MGFGVGTQQTRIEGEEGIDNASKGNSRIMLKLGTGYNGKKFHSGVSFSMDNVSSKVTNALVSMNTAEVQAYIGWRFSAMNWTWLDKIEDQYF